jgi:hypothetical protein
MDLTIDNFILIYGGLSENLSENLINMQNIDDFTKIIKYNDYKNCDKFKINNNECSICLEEFKREETTHNEIIKSIKEYKKNKYQKKYNCNNDLCIISCYHIFHIKCLSEWYDKNNESCPLCRINLKKIK